MIDHIFHKRIWKLMATATLVLMLALPSGAFPFHHKKGFRNPKSPNHHKVVKHHVQKHKMPKHPHHH